MAVRFIRPDGARISAEFCERKLNLLAHAQALELDLGSECGGHGVCGKDRLRISPEDSRKLSAVTEVERRHLTAEELAMGWRLGCQCYPENDGDEIEARSRF
jgi:ferredoxin